MPNWSDDEGRCHFMVGRVPCWQSSIGCPMHAAKEEKPKRQAKVKLSAYEQCLNALNMTERDQRVEVEPKVLERLLKDVNRLTKAEATLARQRAEIRRLREAFARFLLGCDLVNTHENHARLIEANKALAPKRRAKR